MRRHGRVRRELGLHHVAGLAAKLDGVHVLDGAITELARDHHVRDSHHAKEDARASPGGPAVFDFRQILDDLAPSQGDTDRDQMPVRQRRRSEWR